MAEHPNWADELMAWSALATVVLTGFLLVAAWLAWRTARATFQQLERDSIEKTRPYVYVEVVPSIAGTGCYDVVVSNRGRSAARDVTLTFDRWSDQPDDIALEVARMFRTARTVPPASSIRAYWRLEGNLTDGKSEAGMGPDGTITVTYGSDEPSRRDPYSDTFEVLIHQSGLWPVPEAGPNPPASLSKEARGFYVLGQALIRRIGELRR